MTLKIKNLLKINKKPTVTRLATNWKQIVTTHITNKRLVYKIKTKKKQEVYIQGKDNRIEKRARNLAAVSPKLKPE